MKKFVYEIAFHDGHTESASNIGNEIVQARVDLWNSFDEKKQQSIKRFNVTHVYSEDGNLLINAADLPKILKNAVQQRKAKRA
jgi:flagellar hook assembly protein FlgD